MSQYNATVHHLDAEGKEIGVFVAEVNDEGLMLRSNWIQCTGLEGTVAYDAYLKRTGHTFRVVKDGCAGYRRRLLGFDLPLAYRR